ncbi:MAG TPA: hypothetical protein VEQ18_05730, partial [Candidatus Nitrosocosmicus sp.]|nr:hypothetical protein [Candidatus Nitrosocosmicus sp.]
ETYLKSHNKIVLDHLQQETLYLIKKAGGAHLKSTIPNFPLEATPLESTWNNLSQEILPHFPSKQSMKLIHKLLLHNIYKIKHLTLPNGTNLMSHSEFEIYYTKPTKLIKQALHIAEQLFCHPRCNPNCQDFCNEHYPQRTLKKDYITLNHHIRPKLIIPPIHPPTPPHYLHPRPPQNIRNNPATFPIETIIDHKDINTKDKYKIPKQYQSNLCQWNLPNNIIYNKWVA